MSEYTNLYYDEKAPCPKCGYDDIVDTYLAKGEVTLRGVAVEDIIDRQCQNCYHNWASLPKDHVDYPEELRCT